MRSVKITASALIQHWKIIGNGFGGKFIILGADMSNSSHANKKK